MKKYRFCAAILLISALLVGVASCSKKEKKSSFEESITSISEDIEKGAKKTEKEMKKAAKKAEKDIKKAKSELEKQFKD